MNYTLIRHLMLKDVRHQRVRLALIWLTAYLLPLTNLFPAALIEGPLTVTQVVIGVVAGFLVIYGLASTMLLDPTCGSVRFLSTRPIGWTTLLASKVCFVLLFLGAPVIILRLLTLWTTEVPLSFTDQALNLLETVLFGSTIASIVILPALFFQRFSTYIMGVVICGILLSLLYAIGEVVLENYNLIEPISSVTEPENASYQVSRFSLACAIIALTLIPVAITRYWRPALPIPLTLALGGLFLAFAYFAFPPPPLDHIDRALSNVTDTDKIGEAAPTLRDQIHFHVSDMAWDISRSWVKDDYNAKNHESHLIGKVQIVGLQRPYFLVSTKSEIHSTLSSGKKLSFQEGPSQRLADFYRWDEDYFRLVCAAIPLTNPNYDNFDMVQTSLLYGHVDLKNQMDISDSELPGASVQERLTFTICRINVLAVMPFKPGAGFNFPRQCYKIHEISYSPHGIRFLLNESSVPLLFRGGYEQRLFFRESYEPFVIINRRTGEILDQNSQQDSDYSNPLNGLHYWWITLYRATPPKAPRTFQSPPIPPHWLDDADICFYTLDDLGTVTFPFSTTVTKVIR